MCVVFWLLYEVEIEYTNSQQKERSGFDVMMKFDYSYKSFKKYTDDGTKYALDVVNGRIMAGDKVIKACKRHLRDLKNQEILHPRNTFFDYVYLPEKAEIAVTFMEALPDISTGEALPLADFQKFIVYSLYGWYRRDDHELRRFNKALISMARKNGKSALISSLAIWELLAGKYPKLNRQIYCTAQNREQAHIVFEYVSQRLDGLLSKSKSINKQTKKIRNEIKHLPSYSILKPLSRDTTNLNGLAPTLSILDEYGGAKTNEMLEVMESGAMLQPNLLTIIISTAYFNLNAPMYSVEYKHCEKILNEEIEQDNYFALIYEQDSEEEIQDESKWIKSNPLLSVKSINDTLMRNLKARVKEKTEQNDLIGLIVKTFNMWKQASDESFLPSKEWESCYTEPINTNGRDVYIGIDLSRINDLTATSFIYPLENNKFYVDNHSFVATTGGLETKSQRDKIDYQLLINRGYATASNLKSGFIDYIQVIDYLGKKIMNENLDVLGICYDPHMMEKFIPEWEKRFEGTSLTNIPFIEVPQNFLNLSQPIKEFQFNVYERNILHSNNPNLNIAVNNAVIRYDNNANVILDKQKAREKIDPLVALVTAYAEAMHYEYKGQSNQIDEDYILSDDFGF